MTTMMASKERGAGQLKVIDGVRRSVAQDRNSFCQKLLLIKLPIHRSRSAHHTARSCLTAAIWSRSVDSRARFDSQLAPTSVSGLSLHRCMGPIREQR